MTDIYVFDSIKLGGPYGMIYSLMSGIMVLCVADGCSTVTRLNEDYIKILRVWMLRLEAIIFPTPTQHLNGANLENLTLIL